MIQAIDETAIIEDVVVSEPVLTVMQQAAVDAAVKSIESKATLFRIGGYAGTGKTTVAKYIVEKQPGCMPCAFTGKAANRLREKGLGGTQTIHKTIYDYDRSAHKFNLKPSVDGDWFLIDEGSMVSRELWTDLLSFKKPIVMLGDPGQLEPVGDDPRLMHKPDLILDQIHRQAEGSGIIQFATDIRKKYPLQPDYGMDVIMGQGRPTIGDLKWADIVLCGMNRTRHKINGIIRQLRGYSGLLQPGEQIICLKNNMEVGVFNGQLWTIEEIIGDCGDTLEVKVSMDDGMTINLMLFKPQFGQNPIGLKELPKDRSVIIADYGY
jgi:exodeoxyribonuclease-5